MRYPYVFFDLDGTLLESAPGVKGGIAYALRALGRPAPPAEELDFVLGPPLYYSFHEGLGLAEDEAQRAVELYREYYQKTGIWQCRLFDGMGWLLRALHARGARLGVVTGKPQMYAGRLMAYFGLRPFLDVVVGTDRSEREVSKTQMLQRAMTLAGAPSPRAVLMVGDRCYDIDGARGAGVDSLGVLFGYGSRAELEQHGATYLAADAREILRVCEGGEE